MRIRKIAPLALAAVALACASGQTPASDLEAKLSKSQQEIEKLQSSVSDRDRQLEMKGSEIQRLSQKLEERALPAVSARPAGVAGGDLLPPSAKPGECYARIFVPATFTTEQVRVLKRQSSERIEIVPERYETVTERVLVKEASQRLEVVPATYGFVEDRQLVQPEGERIIEVPARYEWTEEKVLVEPARTEWKKGRGPIERVDNATGEIMCLVDVPARYETVRKRVLAAPATTRVEKIPAKYQTVKKRVLKTPATTRTIEIPAEYKTIQVRKLVQPATTKAIEIPAQYATVQQKKLVSDGEMAWRPILCETNATPGLVADIQRALDRAGHSPGPIDGVLGSQTMAAVTAFQRSKGLSTGNLTIKTLDALGVQARR